MALPIGQLGTSEPRPTLLLARDIETIIGALSRSLLSQSTGSRAGLPGGWHGSGSRRAGDRTAWRHGRTRKLTAAPDIAPALDREVLGHTPR